MTENVKWRGMIRRRSLWLPTLRGWLVILAVGALGLYLVVRNLHPFLALSDPNPQGILAIEGWAPDYAFEAAIAEFRAHPYQLLCVTGGPLDRGMSIAGYKTCAELGAATLVSMGMNSNQVLAVPAPLVRQDRTFVSASCLKSLMEKKGLATTNLHVITVGPHARRTRLMFEKAFGDRYRIGITSVPSQDFDAGQWWKSSAGFRGVTSETIAYAYARFIFRVPQLDVGDGMRTE